MAKARKANFHLIYTWLVIAIGFGLLFGLSSTLLKSADLWREYIIFVILGVLAEWFVVSLPHGNISVGFVLISGTFLIYNTAATAWISSLSILISNGLVHKESPWRTTLFNTAQYSISAYIAGYAYILLGGEINGVKLTFANLPYILAFVATYFSLNHILVNIYLSPQLKKFNFAMWKSCLKWDAFTYAFSTPLGMLMAMLYKQTGIWGATLLFLPVLSLNYLLKLYINLEIANKELSALYQVAKRLGGSLDLTKTLNLILKETKRIINYHTGIIYLWIEEEQILVPAAIQSPYEERLRNVSLKLGEGIIGFAAKSGEATVVIDTKMDPRVDANELGINQFLRSMLIVPLMVDNQIIGVVVIGKKSPGGFSGKQLQVLTILGGQAAVAMANSMLYKRIEKLAVTDGLTKLFNHRFFYQRIEEEFERGFRYKSTFSLILMDIDYFKKFNDTYGHMAGDIVLASVAKTIKETIRTVDLAARYGGEEFAVLLPETGEESALIIAERIRKNIQELSVDIGSKHQSVRITISVGVATYPDDAKEIMQLIERTDKALYFSKSRGKNKVSSYREIK